MAEISKDFLQLQDVIMKGVRYTKNAPNYKYDSIQHNFDTHKNNYKYQST